MALSQEGMPKMDIYFALEQQFHLEERQIRRILQVYQDFQRQWNISITEVVPVNPQTVAQATNAFPTFVHSSTMEHPYASDTCHRSVCTCPYGECPKKQNDEVPDSNLP